MSECAFQPRPERRLVRKSVRAKRIEFRREEVGVGSADAEYDQGSDIAEQRGPNRWVKLICELVHEAEVGGKFSCLAEERGERVGAEGLKLVDMDEEWNPLLCSECATLHRRKLQVRYEKRPQKIGSLLPI
jgi:hypothetical protein